MECPGASCPTSSTSTAFAPPRRYLTWATHRTSSSPATSNISTATTSCCKLSPAYLSTFLARACLSPARARRLRRSPSLHDSWVSLTVCVLPADLTATRWRRSTVKQISCSTPAEWITCPTRSSKRDRKSTRLNSSHHSTSYAVFCLK